MTLRKDLLVLLLGVLALALTACGGSGQGLRIEDDPVGVSSTSLPAMMSGETINHVIPIKGGCGGPYVLKVISGRLPEGVELDSENHSLTGYLGEDGRFDVTLEVIDTGCEPFSSTTANFTLEVGVGSITVVGVRKDGSPSKFIAAGEGFSPADERPPEDQTPYNPDFPAFPDTIFNQYTMVDLVLAGGRAPYTIDVHDATGIPDGALPLGVSLIPASTAFAGTPIEEATTPTGAFLLTLQITDSVGSTSLFTAYWLVYSPPLLIAVGDGLSDGQAGSQYSETFSLSGGIPPFNHSFVDAVGSDVRITAANYPAPSAPGLDYTAFNCPSEGTYLVGDTGSFRGIPRRRGDFSMTYFASSQLLPFSPTQRRWHVFTYTIIPADPLEHNPIYTVEGAFAAAPPYANIQEAEQGAIYNPDGGPVGLQLLCRGGVPQDGRTDAPHESQTANAPGETDGAYDWSMDWDPVGAGTPPAMYMELLPSGVFRIEPGEQNNLAPQLDQVVEFTAGDFALPDTLAVTGSEMVNFAIGPDRVIVTESPTSHTTLGNDNRRLNDTALTLKVLIPRAAGDEYRDPNTTDLVGTGTGQIGIPTGAGTITLANLLKTMDMTRVSVNPTGWWDDVFHLNPKAARPFQHGDRNSEYAYYGMASNGTTTSSSYYSSRRQWQPTAIALRLPETPTVTADKATGVYANGGKFYIFDTSTHLGVLIVRKDGRLYIPAAFRKTTSGWTHFGDNWTEGHKAAGSSNSINKIPQMTVSPDGRFAALKLKGHSSYSRTEYADDSAILLISLTGERIPQWGTNAVMKVINTGSSGSFSTGYYHFASSSTLTNRYLYYICGSSTSSAHWRYHYIYRYDLFSGATSGALLHSNFNGNWTNSSGSYMQTPFQHFYDSFSYFQGGQTEMVTCNGYNSHEVSLAPHPFRVSANGMACAILAGTYIGTSGSSVMSHHVWVDYNGSLHQLSNIRRRTTGGGRGSMMQAGTMDYPSAWQWGTYDGPTTRFEISDDGLKVAVVYRRHGGYGYSTSSSSTAQRHYRSDIAAYSTTPASMWASVSRYEITGNTTTSTSPIGAKFSTPQTWRFGALTFTKDGAGLIFWGGFSNYSPTATYSSGTTSSLGYMYYGCKSYVGSIYSFTFADSSVRNILAASSGGCNKTVGTAFTSTSFSTSSWSNTQGMIKPWGGFISPNRNFLFIRTRGAITSTNQRDNQLIGVNIRSLDTTQNINNRTDGRAYLTGGWAHSDDCGFSDNGFYVHYYGFGYRYNYYGYHQYYCSNHGGTLMVTATDKGWVYFVSGRNGSASSYQSSRGGGARYTTKYSWPYHPKTIYVFHPDVGGDVQIVQAPTSGWTGSRYSVVGGIETSDDGSSLAAVYTTSAYYTYNNRERFRTWTNLDLDPDTGELLTTPVTRDLETSGYVSSHFSFGTKVEDIYFAQGSSNENGKTLRTADLQTGTKSDFPFPTRSYNVLHVGR